MALHFKTLLPRSANPDVRRLRQPEVVAYLNALASRNPGLGPVASAEEVKVDARVTIVRWTSEHQGQLYARLWAGKSENHPVVQYLEGSKALREAGLLTPRIVHSDRSIATGLRWGLEAVIEASAPGVKLTLETSKKYLGLIACELARLHRARGKHGGRPWMGHRGSARGLVSDWEYRIGQFEKRITPKASGLASSEIEQSLRRLRIGMQEQTSRRPVLTQGDVNFGNLFVDENDVITWIDFEAVEYAPPERDLASLWHRTDRTEFRNLIEAYETFSSEPVDRRHLNTWLLFHNWKRLYKRIRKSRLALEEAKGPLRPDEYTQEMGVAIRELMADSEG